MPKWLQNLRSDLRAVILAAIFTAIPMGVWFALEQATKDGSESTIEPPEYRPYDSQGPADILKRGSEERPVIISIKKSDSDKKESEQDKKEAKEVAKGNRLQMVFNGGLLFCTLVQIFMAVFHRREDADESIAKKRAWVSISPDFPRGYIPEQEFVYNLRFRMHGPTPAFDVSFRSKQWLIQRPPNGPEFPKQPSIDGKWNTSLTHLLPNVGKASKFSQNPITTVGTGFKPKQAEIEMIRNETHVIVLGIEVKYRDAFKHPRMTREYYGIYGEGINMRVVIIPGHGVMT
jgi:hypothetical protein